MTPTRTPRWTTSPKLWGRTLETKDWACAVSLVMRESMAPPGTEPTADDGSRVSLPSMRTRRRSWKR